MYKLLEEQTKSKNGPAKKRAAESVDEPGEPKQRKLEDCIPATQEALNKAIDDATRLPGYQATRLPVGC